MKKIICSFLIVMASTFSYGKKVRFACDMTGVPVNVTGMHISGDFQTAAGFPGGDWNSATTPLTQEGSTNVYSIIVDIPAFAKYEYKFVNGDLFYEVEFVPEPSRVGYNFNDNRWIYIDSLANDTTDIGAILFGQNAPAGLTMVRFFVDMAAELPSVNGVHLAGSFQGFNPATTIMYSFGIDNTNGPSIYEVLVFVPQGTYEYKFFNGNSPGTEEIVPGACSVNSNREITVSADTLLANVCFASCNPCPTGINEILPSLSLTLSPNPAKYFVRISWAGGLSNNTVELYDVSGRKVQSYYGLQGNSFILERASLDNGIYFVRLSNENTLTSAAKLIIN